MHIRLLLVIGTLLGANALCAQVIVANPSVKITEMRKSDLRDIFTGASGNYKDGSRAVPVTLKNGPAQDVFLKEIVGKSDAAFRATWRAVLFAGQGVMPQAFDSEAALLAYVASVPGAIGYVSASANCEKVKTIAIK